MTSIARATRRNDRYVHHLGDRTGKLQIVANPGAITVDARQQNLSCATPYALRRPLDGVELSRCSSTTDVHPPPIAIALGINAGDHTLRAKPLGRLGEN